jgi:alkylhydroperoxidase/carboxymuconolactone decarboxylase family protein YurZ
MAMDDFEVLLSGMPDVRDRFSELKGRVLGNGPLDARSRALAAAAIAIAVHHPALADVLVSAKQSGIRNEEISHVAAIAAVLRVGGFAPSAPAANGQQQSTVATCC